MKTQSGVNVDPILPPNHPQSGSLTTSRAIPGPRRAAGADAPQLHLNSADVLERSRYVLLFDPGAAYVAFEAWALLDVLSAGTFLHGLGEYGVISAAYAGYDLVGQAPAHPNAADVQAYLAPWLRTDELVIFLTSSPPSEPGFVYGTDYAAYHSWTSDGRPYAVVPYTDVPRDWGWDPLSAFLMVLGHEFAEAHTDPTGHGWVTDDGSEADDFAPCLWVPVPVVTKAGPRVTQGYWRNSVGACWNG